MSSARANKIGCAEFRQNLALDRRGFVRAGFLGLAGLTLANLTVEYPDISGRPHPVLPEGMPIDELFT